MIVGRHRRYSGAGAIRGQGAVLENEMTMRNATISAVRFVPFDVTLRTAFGIATGALSAAQSVLVEVELADGTVGIGEAAPFPAVNGETRAQVLDALGAVQPVLVGGDAGEWRRIAALVREVAPQTPTAWCATETAVLDALTRRAGISLRQFFGGAERSLTTDITIVTGNEIEAEIAAREATEAGFGVLKIKVGGAALAHDVARLRAVAKSAPDSRWILDGNTALTSDEAAELVRTLGADASRIVLFEQPTPAGDLEGLRAVHQATGVFVAADESAKTAADVARIASCRAAQVVNVKIAKSGIAEALEMIAVARAHGLALMIGGMVETTLAMSTSACLAAGIGGFSFVDLDTPLFMKDSPMSGGFRQVGPRLDLEAIEAGHGVRFAYPRHAVAGGGVGAPPTH